MLFVPYKHLATFARATNAKKVSIAICINVIKCGNLSSKNINFIYSLSLSIYIYIEREIEREREGGEGEREILYIQGVPGGMCHTSGECSLC